MSENLKLSFVHIGMLDSASLETAAENTIQLLTALKPHVKGKHVEKATRITANLKKDANI